MKKNAKYKTLEEIFFCYFTLALILLLQLLQRWKSALEKYYEGVISSTIFPNEEIEKLEG